MVEKILISQKDTFQATVDICVGRFKRQGYLTEKDKKLFLKGCSILCGFPVTVEHLKELKKILPTLFHIKEVTAKRG